MRVTEIKFLWKTVIFNCVFVDLHFDAEHVPEGQRRLKERNQQINIVTTVDHNYAAARTLIGQSLHSIQVWRYPENTHLLRKGKYHCMTDLLFDWFGFDRTCKCLSNSTQPNQMNPNQSNRRLAMQWYLPLQSKWVFFEDI